jgi:uncharacterized protein (TIGR02996 family)
MFHFEPDPAVVSCLGCGELTTARDRIRHERHLGLAAVLWHPYHLWCLRDAPPDPSTAPACAECGVPLDRDALRAVITWGSTSERRLGARLVGAGHGLVRERPDAVVPRPPGLRLVAVAWYAPGRSWPVLPRSDALFSDGEPMAPFEEGVRGRFEVVHEVCPRWAADHWAIRLREAPGDDEIREAYADALEQTGDEVRARFVRAAVAHRRDPAADPEDLRPLAHGLSSSWVRSVLEEAASK